MLKRLVQISQAVARALPNNLGQPVHQSGCIAEPLEKRIKMSTNVLSFHNDTFSNGVNATETTLSAANVKVGSFGKTATVPVDGNVYTEPLLLTGTQISAGPNTNAGMTGVHDAAFIATENDSLYAIDTHSGAILWQRSFLSIGAGAGNSAGSNINNPLNATAITAPNDDEVQCQDIGPTYGITGTPVIDASTGTIYLVAFTKEMVGGVANYVQRVHALNVSNGTDVVAPYLLGSTIGSNTNTTSIYAYGNGDGNVVDPYNKTGRPVVQFNALRENQREALTLVNNTIYIAWASHCDDAPYHGWICSFDVSHLTTGITLKGVFCSSPNGGEAGIWSGGGKLTFEADGNTCYFETGNGSSGGAIKLDTNGFPITGSYYEAVGKLAVDPTTSATNQNTNGWGLKVVDYFIPSNQPALDNVDQDLGSGGPLILPASAGIPGHPNLLIAGGKQGVIYVIDRSNMGKFNPNYDNVLNAYAVGQATPPVAINGLLSTPVYYNGQLYMISGYSGYARSFQINSTGTLAATSQSTNNTFGYLPGSPIVSSNGAVGGILWQTDRASNALHAYDTGSLSTELWNSAQRPNNADAPGAIVKLAAPTVANGQVFLGTTNSLVIYGLTPPSTAVPVAPALASTAISATSVNLSWTDGTSSPNTATSYSVEQLINGAWTVVTTVPGGYVSTAVGGLALQTSYSFRIRGLNGIGYSAYSSVSQVTTSNVAANLNFAYGFAGSSTQLTYNGSAAINQSSAMLTNGGPLEASSLFSNTPVDVTKFSTTFHFQLTAGAAIADGMTFCIQGNSSSALGSPGGGLGYAGDGNSAGPVIAKSIAIKFDLYDNAGEGTNSTGLYENGTNPTVPSVDLTPSGVNLHSGDLFQATLSYDGAILTQTLLDTTTGSLFTHTYSVNIPADTGSTAYVGFTAGTGGNPTVFNVLDWTFSPNANTAPAAPSGLGATVASATSINLSWTNNATNQTGFALDRATDALFSQNLVTQTLPAAPNSTTDIYTGLASGGIYYYRLRATNTAGSSVSSNTASISIPFSPPTPTNGSVEQVATDSISLSWTDNAGVAATGYRILRAVNHGAFVLYTTLPATNAKLATEYDWTDAGVTPGTFYDYHIQCFNIAGYNDFTGCNATTLTLAPTALTASSSSLGVSLSWAATSGAQTYNVYRGTAAGGEYAIPLAAGVTAAFYSDSSAIPATQYYYYVTAINGNLLPLKGESSASNETSVTSAAGTPATLLDLSAGFSGSGSKLTYNNGAMISGSLAQLSNGAPAQASSIFSSVPFNVSTFTTSFAFQASAGVQTADGFTFCIQSNTPTALGGSGGGLGYASDGQTAAPAIGNSIAVKFDLYNNAGEGSNSTGLYLNGASPTSPAVDLTASGINLHSGDLFQVTLSYDGTTLLQMMTDTATGAVFTQSYAVNIAAVTGTSAYIGFTAGTGGYTTVIDLSSWVFNSTPAAVPAAPSNLSGNASSASTIVLSWTNNASNPTGFILDRATNSSFTAGLISQTLPAAPFTVTDAAAGISAGGTYYYRIRAIGPSGSSTPSPFVTVNVPGLPAAPTVAAITSVGVSSISIAWVDNAQGAGSGYTIQRAVNHGSFTTYKTLPALTNSFVDTQLSAGTFYDYRIQSYNVAGTSAFAEVTCTTLTAAPSGLTANTSAGSISLAWTAPVGAVAFNVYRGTVAGGESASPIASGITATNYSDITVLPATQYFYAVTAVNSNVTPVNAESALSGEISATSLAVGTVGKLTGTAIGAGGSFSDASGYASAFDTSLTTYFDPANSALTNWVGLDLGTPQAITQIKYAPRSGYEYRMYTGQFQVSNTANFSTGVVTLFSVAAIPASGQLTTATVNPGGNYRYVRYVGGTQWVNIAEFEVDGIITTVMPPPMKLTGAVIGAGGSYSAASTYAQVFDGNLTTFFDPANASLTNYVGLDLLAVQTITQLKFAPRSGFAYRMVGGQFQASNSLNFSSGVVTLYTVTTAPAAGLTTVSVSVAGTYRYVRYTGGTQWVNIAEMEIDGVPVGSPPPIVKLTGTAIGAGGSFVPTSAYSAAFDGSLSTYFDPASGGLTDWVGLDLGSAKTITQIRYAPRAGNEFRMFGGQFQVSNTADFSTGVVTIYTVSAIPVSGQLTTVAVSPPGTYRYIRYTGGNQWVNIAEMEVDGLAG